MDCYTAEDAALMVDIDDDPLEVEVDLERAIEDGAPLVHRTHPNNVAAHFAQVSGDPDHAIRGAEHVTRVRVQVVFVRPQRRWNAEPSPRPSTG